MSELVILLPPRPRDGASAEAPADLAFVLSTDGRTVARQGRAEPARMPRATSVVAVLHGAVDEPGAAKPSGAAAPRAGSTLLLWATPVAVVVFQSLLSMR